MMNQRYIVVADQTRARVYLYDRKNKQLNEQYDLFCPEGRQQAKDIYTDRPGRNRADVGGERHALARDNLTRDHETAVFAREIGSRLEADRNRNKIDELTVIAPPHFLGELRKHLSPECGKLVVRTIDKNLSKSRDEEIVRHLLAE
ncbi:MAG: host attachment protein [Pseudohongiellaceae bacterium]